MTILTIRERYAETLCNRAYELLDGDVSRENLMPEALRCADELNFKNLYITNDLKRQQNQINIETIANKIPHDKHKTLTMSGAIFHTHDKATNYMAEGLKYLGGKRKEHKKKLPQYKPKSSEYIYNDLIQGVYKVIMNSFYGILNSIRSFIYHQALGPSVTYTAWCLITHMIQTFEDFTNNPRHRDPWELCSTIDLILSSRREINTLELRQISFDELYSHLMSNTEINYVDDIGMVKSKISMLNADQRIRVFYAFNPLSYFKDTRTWLNVFLDPKAPDFNAFNVTQDATNWYVPLAKDIMNACFYPRVLASRENRAQEWLHATEANYGAGMRRITILSDTDSSFLHFGYWLREISAIDARINTPSIINNRLLPFLINLYQEIAKGGIDVFCESCNIPKDFWYLIVMKNEFHMNRTMLTPAKRNYATHILNREGAVEDKIDVKGLKFMKTVTAPESRRKIEKELLEQLIFRTPTINVRQVLEWLEDFSDQIQKTVDSGKLTYANPMQVGEDNKYKFPERMQQVRGAKLWNRIYPNTPIQTPSKANVVKLSPHHSKDIETRTDISSNFKKILLDALENEPMLYKYGLTTLSLPSNIKQIPKEFIPLVDVRKTISDQIDNAKPILKSLGLNMEPNTSFTNQAMLTVDPTRIATAS